MELYTLDSGFLRDEPIDTFASVIWTERYSSAGEVNLVTDATQDMISKLAKGTFLSCVGTKEVMLLDTQEINDDKLTVKGSSLLAFLEHRILKDWSGALLNAMSFSTNDAGARIVADRPAGETMSFIVKKMLIDTTAEEGRSWGGELFSTYEVFPNLSLGAVDSSGGNIEAEVPWGPIYSALKKLAEQYAVGMSLYLDSATIADYFLKFKTYKGLDRTSAQSVNDVVRFSPYMDSLTNVKELHSDVGYKNVVYAFRSGDPSISEWQVAYANPGDATAIGFDRRSMLIIPTLDIDTAEFPVGAVLNAEIERQLLQLAKDALANNNYTKLVDGEVVPQSGFEFGTDYNLGDIVELQGLSGTLQNARITEYIRAQDDAGERGYPTVSVIE